MIRLSEIRLPLGALPTDPETHPEAALRAAAAQALGIAPAGIAHVHVFKRSFDARKADLLAVYIVDITLAEPAQEAALLAGARVLGFNYDTGERYLSVEGFLPT